MTFNLYFRVLVGLLIHSCFCAAYSDYMDPHNRTYRGLTLRNGMKLILIHDNGTGNDAISLSVGVGSLQNPSNFQGLAHLLEHLAFSNEPGNLLNLITSADGYYNAQTYWNRTQFTIQTKRGNLEGILTKFRDEIFKPTLTLNSIESEAKILDTEFKRRSASSNDLIYRVLQLTSKKGHPFKQFDIGNYETLWENPNKTGVNVATAAKSHFGEFYNPDNMGLVVLSGGNLDLSGMQSLVESIFLSVNGTTKRTNRDSIGSPWGKNELGTKLEVQTSFSNADYALLYFPVPTEYNYMFDYFKRILNGRHKGSLQRRLKNFGYATSHEVFWQTFYEGFSHTVLSLKLTKLGVQKADDILNEFFKYVAFLRSSGPSKVVWDDVEETRILNLFHGDRQTSLSLVSGLGETILEADPNTTVYLSTKKSKLKIPFDGKQISKFLEHIDPQNMRYVVATNPINHTINFDPIYGIKYNYYPLPASLIQQLNSAKPSDGLTLPSHNIFIPKNFELKNTTFLTKWLFRLPRLIKETKLSSVWYMPGWVYAEPKVYIKAKLFSPISKSTERDYVKSHVLAGILTEVTSSIKDRIESFGGSLKISHKGFGLEISLSSFNDGIELVLEEIIKVISSPFISNSTFEAGMDLSLSDLLEGNLGSPCQRAGIDQVLQEYGFTFPALYSEFTGLKYHEVGRFVNAFFSKLRIIWLFYGNVDETDVISMVAKADRGLAQYYKTQRLKTVDVRLKSRDIELKKGIRTTFFKLGLATDETTCSLSFYQPDDVSSPKTKVMLNLLSILMQVPFYDDLRGQQQLAYDIKVKVRDDPSYGSSGIYLYAEGEHNPAYVKERTRKFLLEFKEKLNLLPDKDFNEAKKAVQLSMGSSFYRMEYEALYFWSFISNDGSSIIYTKLKYFAMETLQKEDLLDFYDDLFGISNRTARQMSIFVYKPESLKQPTVTFPNLMDAKNGSFYNVTESEETAFERVFQDPFTEVIASKNLPSWKQNQTLLPTFSYLETIPLSDWDYEDENESEEFANSTLPTLTTKDTKTEGITKSEWDSKPPNTEESKSTSNPWPYIELGCILVLLIVVISLCVYIFKRKASPIPVFKLESRKASNGMETNSAG